MLYYNKGEIKMLKMSDQFIGCVMMALQKALLEEIDITQLFRDLEIENDENLGLVVKNPPSFQVKIDKEEQEELAE